MLFVYILFASLFISQTAHAWGPGTHLEIALTVLQNLAWCLPLARKVIEKFPNEFIYGCVSPDIITGKKFAGWMHHCHNWSVGKLILEESKSDPERAAAWGYLTHLAADTVAHNYFVPFKIIQSFPKQTLGHAYWEMRYDIFVTEESWSALSHVIRKKYSSFDLLLERVLKKTLFSFSTNKKIFNSILILHKMKQLRFGLKTYAKVSRWTLAEGEVKQFRRLTLETVRDFLSHPERARCLAADPAGLRKQVYAQEMQKKLRRLNRAGIVSAKKTDLFIDQIGEKLRQSLFDPKFGLPGVEKL